MSSKCPTASSCSHSSEICLKPAVNFILMVATPFADSCTSPPPPSPSRPPVPLLHFAFPSAVTNQSVSLPCIISVSRAYGSIRPGWEVQIVTGVMWTGSLHMPPLVPPPGSQSSANHRLRIYLFEFNSAFCHLFTRWSRSKRWDKKNTQEKKRRDKRATQFPNNPLSEAVLYVKPPRP